MNRFTRLYLKYTHSNDSITTTKVYAITNNLKINIIAITGFCIILPFLKNIYFTFQINYNIFKLLCECEVITELPFNSVACLDNDYRNILLLWSYYILMLLFDYHYVYMWSWEFFTPLFYHCFCPFCNIYKLCSK